jgi:hypothetical protein
MAELINELIAPEVFTQLKEAEEGLDNLAKSVANLGKMGKVIEFNVKGATSLNEYTAAIEEMKKATAAMGAMSEQYSKQVQNVTSAERDQAAARRDNARAMLDEEKAAKLRNGEIEREEKALKNLNNEYETLKRSYTTAANAAKELGIALGTDSKEFKAAASAAKGMYDQLIKVERAVGQGQRAVGQYNQAAFAMQQILRDTPAFAYSFSTGLLAISNNIPILVDRINELKESNKKLVAEGGKALPVWKEVFASMFSGAGIITLVTAAVTILSARLSMAAGGLTEAEKAANKLNEKLIELNETIKETYEIEIKSAGSLLRTMQSLELPYKARVAALDELIKKYPQLLGYLEKEKLLSGEQGNVLDVLSNVIGEEGRIKELEGNIKIFADERKRLLIEQQAYEKSDEGFVATWRQFTGIFGSESDERKKKIDELTKKINDYKDSLRIAKDEVNFLTNPQRPQTGRIREDIEGDIKKYEQIRDLTEETSQEHANANAQLIKLNAELDRYLNKKKKTPKDTTLKSESELLKAEYELSKQRVEQDAQIQKEIADNEKNSINQRLDAYMEYQADLFQLLRMAKDYEIKQEDLKIQDIKRKKQTATATELIALQDQEDAANKRATGIEEKFQNDLSDVERKGNKDRLAILNTGNEQWIKSEEFRNAKLKEQQVTWFLTQEALLKKALDAKEITTKEYNTRLRNLQKQEGQMLLDDDIDLYTRLLQNKTLSAEKQLEIQNKLNAALKQKSQGGAADAGKRPSGRLTDSLGKSLGIVEEDALQEFYDRTVQLANQAADAIIAAKERQFQAEQDMLDKQKEGIQANYEMQLDYINATTRDETERANKIAQLQAQKATQDASIEQKKREVAKRQATFEKTAAIASIIQNTAVAIAGALKYGVAAPPIIALIAAAGAVQLAAAANAPIPAYKEGTNYHQGGMFIAGDGGQKELIIAPNKKPYFSASTSTLYNEAAGTKVIPGDVVKQMENNITSTASYGGSVMPSIEYDRLATLISDKIGSHLWQHGENLSHTIMAARTKMPKQDMRETVIQLQRLGK